MAVHYKFRRYLRVCRDVGPQRIRVGSAGQELLKQERLNRHVFAGHCGLILFAFDEPQKITKKRLFSLQAG